MSFGGRGPLPRLPGTGGLRRGTGEDDMARLFCLSPGKNNSLGSAKVARSATFELDTLNEKVEDSNRQKRVDAAAPGVVGFQTVAVGPEIHAADEQRRGKKNSYHSRRRKIKESTQWITPIQIGTNERWYFSSFEQNQGKRLDERRRLMRMGGSWVRRSTLMT